MNIYYIDAENTGLGLLAELPMSVLDRVFVFSNSDDLKHACSNALVTLVSGYPQGNNQADFYIIGHLSNVLAHLTKADKKAIEFVLYSKDQDLAMAFKFQCQLVGARARLPLLAASKVSPERAKQTSNVPVKAKTSNKINATKATATLTPTGVAASQALIESQILNIMSMPISVTEMQNKLKVSAAKFAAPFKNLVTSGKVIRQSAASKNWLRVS